MQSMADVSIVGAAGYTGQETLDRVLGHPEPAPRRRRLRLARRAAGRRARPAPRPVPRCRRSSRTTRRSRTVPTSRFSVSPTRLRPRSSLRPPVSSSISRAPIGCGTPRPTSLVRLHASAPGRARRVGLRADRARAPSRGASSRTPGATRRRPCSRSHRSRTRSSPDSVVVDGLSGMTGAGRTLKASTHAGAVLENVAPYRVGAHQHVPEITQLLGFPVSLHAPPPARPARPDRDLQRPLDRCRPPRAARGGLRRQPRRHRPARRGWRRSSPASSTPTGPRSASSATGSPIAPMVICAEDNLGKGAAGQAIQNVNRALGLEPTAGLRLGGVLV